MADLPINKQLIKELSVLGKRYQVLSEDLAHRDTPGRKARDIDPKALEGKSSAFQHQLKMTRTNPNHVHHVTSTGPQPKIKTDRSKDNMDINGNNIDAEVTMEKITETGNFYEEVATRYRIHHDLIRSIVRKG